VEKIWFVEQEMSYFLWRRRGAGVLNMTGFVMASVGISCILAVAL
jgi:hypothetical protein